MSEAPGEEVILYQREGAPAIDAQLSLNQLADLLGRDKSTIPRHIFNVFAEGEPERSSVVAKFATTAADGKTCQVERYNLDAIISVGYRVKSGQGKQFPVWATERLREYLIKGFAMDDAPRHPAEEESPFGSGPHRPASGLSVPGTARTVRPKT